MGVAYLFGGFLVQGALLQCNSSRSKHRPLFICRFKPEQFADANFDAAAYVSQLRRMVRLWCSCSCQAHSQIANTDVFGWGRCHSRH